MQATPSRAQPSRCWWPLLIALPPIAAVLGGIATIYFSAQHPDKEIRVHTDTQNAAEKRHVTNSVVPPLR